MKPIAFSPNWNETPTLTAPSPNEPAIVVPTAILPGGQTHRVIVADDDPVSREILAGLLRKWRYEVILAVDGREAMEMIRAQHEPLLAILDWMMPGMEGTEICRRVREINKSIYVILLTARASKERIVEALDAGADDYLTKPFDKEELRARLNVGTRILTLQSTLEARVAELEATQQEVRELRLRLPL